MTLSGQEQISQTLNAPTARVHEEHDDSMNTMYTPLSTHRDLRVIVGIVYQRRDSIWETGLR
jgi:hypothetical protein